MNRREFIDKLHKKLVENGVGDVGEIVAEYEEHFACKLADGYSEEEIAARLGSPEALALQFADGCGEKKAGAQKALVAAGLVFMDIFAGAFFIVMYAWTAATAALSAASAALGFCMAADFNPYSLIPPMPYPCAAIFAASLLALAVLTAVGCVYFALYVRQLARAYGRCRRYLTAAASGGAPLPPLAAYPKLDAVFNRRLRKTALIALTIFALCLVAGCVVCSVSAGSLGFWHAWNWFV